MKDLIGKAKSYVVNVRATVYVSHNDESVKCDFSFHNLQLGVRA